MKEWPDGKEHLVLDALWLLSTGTLKQRLRILLFEAPVYLAAVAVGWTIILMSTVGLAYLILKELL